jgi:sulfur-carrier protein
MKINLLLFGQLTEITGNTNLQLEDVVDTNHLLNLMHEKFPALKNTKFAIAVDQLIISENTLLTNNSTIALLPAFSGG